MNDFSILLIVAVFIALTWLLVVLCDGMMGEK